MNRVPCSVGLVIGIPTLGRPISLQWALAFKSLHPPINYNQHTITIWHHPIDIAREAIVDECLKSGAKFLFFLGDDVVVPHFALRQLIYRMEQNPKLGVVGGVYCSKAEPAAPLVFKGNGIGSYWDWKVGEYFPVTGLGMDCTLIRVDVFNKLKKPWFKTVCDDKFIDGVDSADQWTEDLYFCREVLEKTEYEIYCDSSILCDHLDVVGNKKYTLPAASLPMRRLEAKKDKRAIDIGCGPIDRSSEFPDYEFVRVDIREEVNPDYRCDVRILPFGNDEFDLVFSSHVLEHFPRGEWEEVFNEWIRVLKPGGELLLYLPNIEWSVNQMVKKNNGVPLTDIMNVFYGAQTNPFDFHYNGFWPAQFEDHLKKLNFTDISIDTTQYYNMIVHAKKFPPIESSDTVQLSSHAGVPTSSEVMHSDLKMPKQRKKNGRTKVRRK